MSDNSKFLAGILLGAAAGAAVALLLGSDKGKEWVSGIRDAAGKAGDDLKDAAGKFQDELNHTIEKGKAFAENLGQKVKEASAQNNL